MKNKLLIYGQTVIILGLLALSIFQQCSRSSEKVPAEKDCNEEYYANVISKQTIQIDSLLEIQKYLEFKIDSVSALKNKEIERIIYKEPKDSILSIPKYIIGKSDTIRPWLHKTETNFFRDSSYEVTTGVSYRGEIFSLESIFSIRKYKPKFIPKTKYIQIPPVIIKEKEKVKLPRVLVGASLNFVNLELDNVFAELAIQDNKGRVYGVSKGILNSVNNLETFKLTYLHPIIRTR